MKKIYTILNFLGIMFASLIASCILMSLSWEFQIEGKAFHCTDIGLGGFFSEMDTHRSAGDSLLGNWTWNELEWVRLIYLIIFFTLWLGGGFLTFVTLRRLHHCGQQPVPDNALHAESNTLKFPDKDFRRNAKPPDKRSNHLDAQTPPPGQHF
jgi:hypothetical protein